MSTILKWAQNTQGKLSSIKNNINHSSNNNNSEKKWIHPPESLQKGHIAYLVKFLGNISIDEPKGIEVVKEAIRKLRFSQQLRKSETGAKTKKVELTISIDGVAIQEPKSHIILHQFPLHKISYCADDKGEKNFFSFIAKPQNGENENHEEKHECFVFVSEKLAEEITLTIGQAFELAYKRFLETSGKEGQQKRAELVKQRIVHLEDELNIYKNRLLDLSQFSSIRMELDQYLKENNLKNILQVKVTSEDRHPRPLMSGKKHDRAVTTKEFLDLSDSNGSASHKAKPSPAVGTKLEGLLLNELDHVVDDNFDPRSFENSNPSSNPPLIAPPPRPAKRNNINLMIDISEQPGQQLASASSPVVSFDPFEMGDFGANSATSQDIENAIGLLDKRIMEMKTGFSRGISFGNDDFSLDNLDPLKN